MEDAHVIDGAGGSVLVAAAAVGLIHTALGPDHYLPFIMLARARGWSPARTAAATATCGLAHVASSLMLGGIGVMLGIGVANLERIENGRGSLAAWALLAFGLAYLVWGVRRAVRRVRGLEPHSHDHHVHVHRHGDRPHAHPSGGRGGFWALFAVFVLGPCEPLIPLFVLPASRGRWDWAVGAAVVFGIVTVATMTLLSVGGLVGLRTVRLRWIERWSHALAGAVIAGSGLAILVLEL